VVKLGGGFISGHYAEHSDQIVIYFQIILTKEEIIFVISMKNLNLLNTKDSSRKPIILRSILK